MTTPFIPLAGIAYNRAAVPNIQPFTVRRGESILGIVEGMRVWMNDQLVPFININVSGLAESWNEEVESLTDQWSEATANLTQVFDEKIAQATSAAEAADIARGLAQIAATQAEMWAANTQVLQDDAVSNLIQDEDSDTYTALGVAFLSQAAWSPYKLILDGLDAALAGKADISVQTTVEEGRLSPESLDEDYVSTSAIPAEGVIGTVLTKTGVGRESAWLPPLLPDESGDDATKWAVNLTPIDYSANVGEKVELTTYVPSDPTNQATHPSVVFAPEGWNGYQYWMAFTPYPAGNDLYENPSIQVSNGGQVFSDFPGLSNPIDTAPAGQYNSDPELVLDGRNIMHLFWRRVNTGTNTESFYHTESRDGLAWTVPHVIFTNVRTNGDNLSPSYIFENGGLTMYCILTSGGRRLVRRFAPTQNVVAIDTNTWGGAEDIIVYPTPAGQSWWHVQVKKFGGIYIALLSTSDTATNGTNGNLYLAQSYSGREFGAAASPLVPRNAPGKHNNMYRACFVPEISENGVGLIVWYSAYLTGPPSVWNIYRTHASIPSFTGKTIGELVIPGGNRFTPVSTNRLVKTNGVVIARFNGTANITINPGTTWVEIPVGFRTEAANVWGYAWQGNNGTPYPIYYNAGDHSIKHVGTNAIPASSGVAFTLIWDAA